MGFIGFNGDSYINNATFAVDTTDDFHRFRVVKDSGTVDLYVDSFDTPVLTVGYNDLIASSTSLIQMAGTTSYGTMNYDVRSFIANTNGTYIPEPSTLTLLAMGAVGLLAWVWRRRKR